MRDVEHLRRQLSLALNEQQCSQAAGLADALRQVSVFSVEPEETAVQLFWDEAVLSEKATFTPAPKLLFQPPPSFKALGYAKLDERRAVLLVRAKGLLGVPSCQDTPFAMQREFGARRLSNVDVATWVIEGRSIRDPAEIDDKELPANADFACVFNETEPSLKLRTFDKVGPLPSAAAVKALPADVRKKLLGE